MNLTQKAYKKSTRITHCRGWRKEWSREPQHCIVIIIIEFGGFKSLSLNVLRHRFQSSLSSIFPSAWCVISMVLYFLWRQTRRLLQPAKNVFWRDRRKALIGSLVNPFPSTFWGWQSRVWVFRLDRKNESSSIIMLMRGRTREKRYLYSNYN